MPDLPRVTIDRRNKKLYFDGVEFPWLIEERGPEVERVSAAVDEYPVVLVPILAGDVEVIPADGADTD